MSENNEQDILDKVDPATEKILIESAWICPYEEPAEPRQKEPPDPPEDGEIKQEEHNPTDEEIHKISLQYKLNLRLQAQRLSRLGLNEKKPFVPVDGLMEGNDWTYNEKDGSWFVPQHDLPYDSHQDSATYDQTFKMDDLKVTKCEEPATTHSNMSTHDVQSDTGANANITSDLSILDNVQWIEPVQCESAKKDASIEVQAIGKYTIRGTNLRINMYYCPESHGTIISPTAIVRQHSHLFHGYQKFVHLDRQRGNITLISREGYENIVIPLVWKNDLWYHTITQPTPTDNNGHPIQVNHLSDVAQWEL